MEATLHASNHGIQLTSGERELLPGGLAAKRQPRQIVSSLARQRILRELLHQLFQSTTRLIGAPLTHRPLRHPVLLGGCQPTF